MKKNISINLQGMIFHIEEDGYEVLRNYLDSIKIYFSGYAGHEEIISDIESRMAEIFFANLTPTKQVITLEDVQALIQKMGSVNDFAQHDKDEDEVAAPKMIGSSAGKSGTHSSAQSGPKRLTRDGNRKVIAGVAAGIAHYLNTDPLWIRLIFLFLILIGIGTAGFSSMAVILVYVLCWIALPLNYDTPAPSDSFYGSGSSGRKLFRNPDDKNLGGVCSGLAMYLGIDSAIVRLLFIIFFFAFGSGLFLYLLLWLILPEAKTPAQKAQMQGKPLTLSGIENSLKNSLQPDGATQEENTLVRLILLPVRLVSQILVVLSRLLGPVISVILIVVRIFAGVLLLVIALSGIIALVSLLGVSLGLFQEASFVNLKNIPTNFFFSDFSLTGKIAGFLTGMIPSVFLIILGIALLSKQFFLRATLGWSLFAIWLISGFIFLIGIISYQNNFEEDGTFTSERIFQTAAYQTVLLDANKIKSGFNNNVDLTVESHTDPDIRLIQEFGAEGSSEEDAVKNAQMIAYRAIQKDSTIILDNSFTYKQNAIYREQNLNLKLRLPEGKQYRITRDLAYQLSKSNFDANYSNDQISRHLWRIKNNIFSCVTCTAADSAELQERSNTNFTHQNGEADFLKNEDDFGSDTRALEVKNFRKVSVVGPFYVKIVKGSSFNVEARGVSEDLKDIRYDVNGSELKIYPKKSGFGLGNADIESVFIRIEMPELTEVSLVGATICEISDFDPAKLILNQTGATRSFVRTNARNLHLELTGASESVLVGETENLKADIVGACNLKANNMKARRANLDVTGGSEASVYVTGNLRGDVTGGSEIYYRGNPDEVNIDEGGGGESHRRD